MDRVFEGLIGIDVVVWTRCSGGGREEGLLLKLKKSEYVKREAKLLGFIVSEKGIKLDPKKKAEFVWNEEQEQEFQSIKRSVAEYC
ncbi:hypothetical protein GNI_065170 [Gregarina niphandrodes]|uniref:Uncharacterized protein n=1 Tax=Gregarina niphandrodes TaxID=110365 RepID=A0A023B7Z9_GRENI|nr:hypothetical protein GNI_065170 [Gregarina niphandrodes]EZG67970.1 hypothetical protein GNI_065170 [Gregarina niphandrodes]|eukprot:XP_011130119.1 hypothetical protein GNI_065170 [Gregarina niphandrodes]